MANLQFIDLQNDVYAHCGLDSTDATTQTNVKRWINYVQQDICSRWPWPFMLGRETFVSTQDQTVGTVSVASQSATVTGSGTNFTGDTRFFIQFSTASDWYQVSLITNSTTLTLVTPYTGPAANNVSYVIRKFFYSLSSSADEIIDIRNWNTPVKLIQVDFRTIDALNPLVQSTNAPYAYMAFGYDSSGNIQLSPYPFPSDQRLFEVRTKKRPVDMVSSGDLPSIPNKFAHVIIFGANALGFLFLRKEEAAMLWNKKYEDRLMQMKKEFRQSGDYQPVLGSIDSVSRSRWIQFPQQYPTVS